MARCGGAVSHLPGRLAGYTVRRDRPGLWSIESVVWEHSAVQLSSLLCSGGRQVQALMLLHPGHCPVISGAGLGPGDPSVPSPGPALADTAAQLQENFRSHHPQTQSGRRRFLPLVGTH